MTSRETNERPPAALLAERLLAGLGSRLAHSRRVAERAEHASVLIEDCWRTALTEAAWLHDIGYHPKIARTGFHPLDGARWLRDGGWPMTTCRLVAWHTGASIEAKFHGLDHDLLAEFDSPPPLAAAVLVWADLTSSPGGEPCDVTDRLAEILERYPAESVVHRAILEASPALLRAASEIESRLATESS
jgi:hypothetical protein